MKYLLDTNIFIFLISKINSRLTSKQLKIVHNPDNQLFISEASLFEMAIKIRMGRSDFSQYSMEGVEKDRKRLNVKILKSKKRHYQNIPNISQILKKDGKPHADPFDLLIISTSQVEGLPVLSTDEYFPDYPNIQTI